DKKKRLQRGDKRKGRLASDGADGKRKTSEASARNKLTRTSLGSEPSLYGTLPTLQSRSVSVKNQCDGFGASTSGKLDYDSDDSRIFGAEDEEEVISSDGDHESDASDSSAEEMENECATEPESWWYWLAHSVFPSSSKP
ncbi:unnamed protein product, partial [Amoebophrya sp. A120]